MENSMNKRGHGHNQEYTDNLPESKRQKLPALSSVIVEAVKVDGLQRLCSSLEPLFRRIVSEEVERALSKLENSKSFQDLQNQRRFKASMEETCKFASEHECLLIYSQDIWKMVFKLLLHPHEWLRNISCRLLNYHFKALDGRKRAESQTLVANSLLEKQSSLFMVAVSLFFQLKEQPTKGNVDVELLTENIVSAVSSLHSLIGQSDQATQSGFWSSLGEDEQVVFLNAFEVLDSGKGRSTFLALTSGRRTENGEEDANDVRNVLIGSLLKRMGKLALDMESVQMRVVFNVYKAFASQMNQEE